MENTFCPPDTRCKKCAFHTSSKLENGYSHLCWIDKIHHYNSRGVEISITDELMLKNFLCPYFRPKNWIKGKESLSSAQLEKIVKQENQIPYFPIILFPKKNQIGPIIRKLARFKVKPKEVQIILESSRTNELLTISDLCKENKIPYSISFSLKDNSWHNIFNKYNRNEFLMLITGYPYLKNDWSVELTDKIQDELFTFSYAENKQNTVMLIPHYMYNSYYFEHTDNFIEKLKEERNAQKYILQ